MKLSELRKELDKHRGSYAEIARRAEKSGPFIFDCMNGNRKSEKVLEIAQAWLAEKTKADEPNG